MNSLLRLSDAASLALHSMVRLACEPSSGAVSVATMARDLGVSEAHLSKVLQRLAKCRLVDSTRGPAGGYRLAEGAEAASLLRVCEAVDGPLPQATCLLKRRVCGARPCLLGSLLTDVAEQVRSCLATRTLADLAASPAAASGPEPER